MQTPRNIHQDCARRVGHYVSGTMDFGIPLYIGHKADWACYKADRWSTSRFIFSLGRWAISWSNNKQLTVALSRTKAEYRGAIVATCDAVWHKRILKVVILVYCDNMSNIRLACILVFHDWTKHIEVHYHFIRIGDIYLQHLSTNLQMDDIFMKFLRVNNLWQFATNLGLSITDQPILRGIMNKKVPLTSHDDMMTRWHLTWQHDDVERSIICHPKLKPISQIEETELTFRRPKVVFGGALRK